MKWTREANVFTDLFIHVKAWRFELPLQDRTELSLSFPSSYFSPFVYSLLSRCCLVFLSLWNDWNLLRFLWANQFTGGEEQKRENFRCVCPPRKTSYGSVGRVHDHWFRWGWGQAQAERLSCSGWGTLTRRVKIRGQTPRGVDRLGGGAVCQARNSGGTVNGALVPHFWRRREMSSFIKAARRLGPVVI